MTKLRVEELWAKACIEQALPDAEVRQHDDGSATSMYDLTIVYPGGSTGAVEVTAAVDRGYIQTAKELDKRVKHWQVPGLTGSWWVRVRPSRVQDLYRQLPGILRSLERDGVREVRGDRLSPNPLVADLGKLQVIAATQAVTSREGRVFVTIEESPERMGGYLPATGDPLASWLGEWLAEPSRGDNLQKLGASNSDEKHIFLFVPGFGAPFAVTALLADNDAPLPAIRPDLPSEITHVWAMSMWIEWGDGFRWSLKDGWRRFGKVKPPALERLTE
jgi:hypothetical protein